MTAPTPAPVPGTPGPITRRGLLRAGAIGGLGIGTVMIGGVEAAFGAPAKGSRPDTLVVINCRGGMDALTVIPPVGDPSYASARPTIALRPGDVKRLDDTFGLHPALGPLVPLWDARKMAVVHAAGLSGPNRSHTGATLALERGSPSPGVRTGWIDRAVTATDPFTAIHLGDPSLPASLLGTHRLVAAGAFDDLRTEPSDMIVPVAAWQTALAAVTAGSPAVAGPIATALAATARAAALPAGEAATDVGYPDTVFGQALHDVARLVKADLGLRIASVDFGGWDMHSGIGTAGRGRMVQQLSEFATTLRAFADEVGPELDGVIVVTLSEFGRRLAENGSGGTDHGHGGAVLLFGGGVVGGKVHGTWPTLASGSLVDGDLAVTTDHRQVLAEIVTKRCGGPAATTVFPGLSPAPIGVVHPAEIAGQP